LVNLDKTSASIVADGMRPCVFFESEEAGGATDAGAPPAPPPLCLPPPGTHEAAALPILPGRGWRRAGDEII
jgi:hypothetical protein